MNKKVFSQLSTMMFLEFFVWGAWFVTIANFMSEIGMTQHIYWAFTVGPIAAIVSPFFLGMIADRFFPTEKILGVLHVIGAAAIFCVSLVTSSPLLFILLLGLHTLCYQPTIALANTLAFSQITNREKEFPIIRVFGTLGWIAAGIFVSGILGADKTEIPLQVSAIAGVVLGLFSFTLPHTPPPAKGKSTTFREITGLDALKKLSSKPFNIYILSSLLTCIPLAAYYSYSQMIVADAGFSRPGFILSFGQMSEVIFIILLPVFLKKLGFKQTLAMGMLAWIVRYGAFTLGAPDSVTWLIFLGVILHGLCYDFFFVTGQIYVDKKSTPEIRGQAQGFNILVTLGVGMFIGTQITGRLFNRIVTSEGPERMQQWQSFWLIPAVIAVAVLIFFMITFKDKQVEQTK
ncbi:MFS transporter [bacterium]|nr:MFS transporter [bacterium]RQV97817.1 MAG: MFS transporter [bacterium]